MNKADRDRTYKYLLEEFGKEKLENRFLFLHATPDFWLGLQMEYDLREESGIKAKEIKAIKSLHEMRLH